MQTIFKLIENLPTINIRWLVFCGNMKAKKEKSNMYATKAEIARIFNCSAQTVYRRVMGIEAEIGKRYNKYAILDGLISTAVYADYEKYRKHLRDRNLRKYVPEFDKEAAEKYLVKFRRPKTIENTNKMEQKHINAILVVAVEDNKMQKIAEYINREIG